MFVFVALQRSVAGWSTRWACFWSNTAGNHQATRRPKYQTLAALSERANSLLEYRHSDTESGGKTQRPICHVKPFLLLREVIQLESWGDCITWLHHHHWAPVPGEAAAARPRPHTSCRNKPLGQDTTRQGPITWSQSSEKRFQSHRITSWRKNDRGGHGHVGPWCSHPG